MNEHKVLHSKYLPTQFLVSFTALLWIFLDRFNAPGWLRGVSWTVIGIVWLATIISFWKQKAVEPKDLLK